MENSLVESINFWVNGVCTNVVVIIGVILNCVAIFIIRKRFENANIFYQMLISLLCFDILVLVTWTNLSLVLAFDLEYPALMHMFPYFSITSTYITITSSTFMTTAIAFERYLAVKDPLKYSQHMKTPKFQEKRLRLYLFIVIVLSVAVNIPHFMEFEVRYVDARILTQPTINPCNLNASDIELLAVGNSTTFTNNSNIVDTDSIKNSKPVICNTEFGENTDYLYYYRCWVRLLITGAIPFALLVIFNVYIYAAMKRSAKRRQRLTSSASGDPNRIMMSHYANQNGVQSERGVTPKAVSMPESVKRKDEENLSMAFVGICSVFLLCHSLKIGLNLSDGLSGKVGGTALNMILGYFSNFLIVLNSAINMVIYCIMNSKFRNYLLNSLKSIIPSKIIRQSHSPGHLKNTYQPPLTVRSCQIPNHTEVIEMSPFNNEGIECIFVDIPAKN